MFMFEHGRTMIGHVIIVIHKAQPLEVSSKKTLKGEAFHGLSY